MRTVHTFSRLLVTASALLFGTSGCFSPEWPNMCFLAGTMISTPDGEVPIEQLKLGQTVLAFDEETAKVTAGIVEKLTAADADHYLEITTASGQTLDVTAEHIMAVRGESGIQWISADQLTTASHLYGLTQELATEDLAVTAIRAVDGPVKVYNFKVRRYHTSFASGVLTHFYYDSLAEMQAHRP